jgi:hypothetical protein
MLAGHEGSTVWKRFLTAAGFKSIVLLKEKPEGARHSGFRGLQ